VSDSYFGNVGVYRRGERVLLGGDGVGSGFVAGNQAAKERKMGAGLIAIVSTLAVESFASSL
jgi:hypothetical protein